MVTVETLSGERDTLLWCADCGAEYSATRADYSWWLPPSHVFMCDHGGSDMDPALGNLEPTPMVEARRVIYMEDVNLRLVVEPVEETP